MASDVRLSVDLEPGDVTNAASDLQRRIEDIFNTHAGEKLSAEMQQLLLTLKDNYEQVATLQAALEKIANTTITPPEFAEQEDLLAKYTDDFNLAKKSADELRETFKNLKEEVTQPYDTSPQYQSIKADINDMARIYDEVSERVQNTEAQLKKATSTMRRFATIANKTGAEKDIQNWEKWSKVVEKLQNSVDADTKSMEQLEANAEILAERLDQLKNKGSWISKEDAWRLVELNDQWQKQVSTMKLAQQNIDIIKQKLQDLIKSGKGPISGEDTKEFEKTFQQLERQVNRTTLQVRKFYEATDSKDLSGIDKPWQTLINVINQGPSAIVKLADTVVTTLPPAVQVVYAVVKKLVEFIWNEFKSTIQTAASILKSAFTKAVNAATTAVKSLTKALFQLTANAVLSPFKRLASAIGDIGKKASSSDISMKKLGRAFIQYGLGARSLYFFVRKLRTALFEGFADLALAYEPFNAAMSQMLTALNYLKNSFAAAFAPIIQYVSPALTILINKLAQAVQMIGQFIAALTGQEFVMAMPVYKDYAENTSAGASAAKEAAAAEKAAAKAEKARAKALKDIQRTIAGFDDVEILKEPTSSDSSDTGTTSSGTPTLDNALATFKVGGPIQSGLQSFVNLIKKAWETANAYDLGVLISQKLGDLLRAFHEKVPDITKWGEHLAKFLATLLAGFLSVGDTFKVLGQVIADAINIIFHTIRTFLDTFLEYDGFKNLGRDIYYVIMNALANINWDDIYQVFRDLGIGMAQVLNETIAKPDFWISIFNALCNALRAVLLRLYYFSATLHWDEIGKSIADGIIYAIENFPVSEFILAIKTFLHGLWTAFYNFVSEMRGHWGEIGTTAANIIIGIFKDFDPVEFGTGVASFLNGLCEAFLAFVNTPGWDEIVDNVALAIETFASEFEWEENAGGLIGFLNNCVTKLAELIDKVDFEALFKSITSYLEKSEEFQNMIGTIVDLIIEITSLKIKAKIAGFGFLGEGIIGYITGGIKDNIKSNAEDATETEMKALEIEFKKRHNDAEDMGAGVGAEINSGLDSTTGETKSWADDTINSIKDMWNNAPWNKTGTNVGSELNSGITSQKQPIHDSASTIKTDVEKTFASADTKLIGINSMSEYNKGISGFRPTITGSLKTTSTEGQEALKAGDWEKIGSSNIKGVDTGMSSMKSTVDATAKTIQTSNYTLLGTGDYTGVGSTIGTKYNSGLRSKESEITSTGNFISSNLYSTLNSGDWYSIGDNIINGIASGIRDGWNWLYNTVWDLAYDLFYAAKRALGIASPSKVFAEKIGEMIPAGISVGIVDNETVATDTINDMADNLVSTAKNIKIPPIAMGDIIPYNTATQEDAAITLNSLLGVLQSLEDSTVKRDELEEIITNVVRTYMNIDFTIGDEKLARHVNRGNSLLDRRYHSVST